MILQEGEWWFGRFDLSHLDGVSPLAVSVRVVTAEHCSEGTNKDGSCRFGLKVFGSPGQPVRPRQPAVAEQPADGPWARQIGGSYAMIASACDLRHAHSDTYHLSVWGWDGTNNISVTASPIVQLSEPYCEDPLEGSAAYPEGKEGSEG